MRRTILFPLLMLACLGNGCKKDPAVGPAAAGEKPASAANEPASQAVTAKQLSAVPAPLRLALLADPVAPVHARLATTWSGGVISFADDHPGGLAFTIARDYSQHLRIPLTNRSARVVRIIAQAGPLDDGLLGDFTGPGSSAQPLEIAPGATGVLMLSVFAQDARCRSARSHVLALDADTKKVLAASPLTLFIKLPRFSLRSTTKDGDPGTLAQRVTLKNNGDALTDLTVEPAAELDGKIYLTPTVEHAYLGSNGSLTFDVHPCLYPGFRSLKGAIVVRGAGQQITVPLSFTVPTGKQVLVGSSNTTNNAETTGKYCTNNPNTDSKVGGPDESLYDKAKKKRDEPRKVPGLPISTDARVHYGKDFGPIGFKGSAGPAKGPDPRGPLVDNDLEVTVKFGPFSWKRTVRTEASISPQVQEPHVRQNQTGTTNASAGRQLRGIDDGIDYGDNGQQNRPRGLRVRSLYAALRPDIYEDNEPESFYAWGEGAILQTWHSNRWDNGNSRDVVFRVWDVRGGKRPLTCDLFLTDPGASGQWPSVVSLPGQRAMVVWETPSKHADQPSLVYRISGPGYGTWSPIRPVPGAEGSPNVGHFDPIAITGPDSPLVLVWQKGDGDSASVLISTEAEPRGLSPPRSPEGMPAGAHRPIPRIAADGAIHLVFVAPLDGRFAVFHAISRDLGATVDPPVRVSPSDIDAGEPDLLIRGSQIHIAFRAGPDHVSRILHTVSSDAGRTWSSPAAVTSEDLCAEYPSLTPQPEGAVGLEFYGEKRASVAAGSIPPPVLKRFASTLGPSGWAAPRRLLTGFPSIESAWLQVNFRLLSDRSSYKAHAISLLLNGAELWRQQDVIPEGTCLVPFHPGLLRQDSNGVPRNIVGLRTRHMNAGNYQSAAHIRLQSRHAGLERLVIATDQAEADRLAAAETPFVNHSRHDLGLFIGETVSAPLPTRPERDQKITVSLRVANLGESDAQDVRVTVHTGLPRQNAATSPAPPLVPAIALDAIAPLEQRDVSIAFPFTGGEHYTITASASGTDFDLRNNVHIVSFAPPIVPTIEPMSRASTPGLLTFFDEPDAPYRWRLMEVGTDKEIVRAEHGRATGPVPPGRYNLALQRYQFEGKEVRFPQVIDVRAGEESQIAIRTAIQLVLPDWADEIYSWQAVDAVDTNRVIQEYLGNHRVMLLPPGDYRIAIQPTQFTSARLVWPQQIRLDQDQHMVVRVDSGVQPPPFARAQAEPAQWSLWPPVHDGKTPIQYITDKWKPLIVPPGRCRWGILQHRYSTDVVVFPEIVEVAAGKLATPADAGLFQLQATEFSGQPSAYRLTRHNTTETVYRAIHSQLTPAIVPEGRYDLYVLPLQYNSKEIRVATGLTVSPGRTLRYPLNTGIRVTPMVDAPGPASLQFVPDGQQEPVQTLSDGKWTPALLPPGAYRVSFSQARYYGKHILWNEVVQVLPNEVVKLTLDSGLRVVGPAGIKPAFEFRVLDSSSKPVQQGRDTWDTQWIPPGVYTVEVRDEPVSPWQQIGETVTVIKGKIIDVSMPELPKSKPRAGSTGAGMPR